MLLLEEVLARLRDNRIGFLRQLSSTIHCVSVSCGGLIIVFQLDKLRHTFQYRRFALASIAVEFLTTSVHGRVSSFPKSEQTTDRSKSGMTMVFVYTQN